MPDFRTVDAGAALGKLAAVKASPLARLTGNLGGRRTKQL